jgi:putative lipoic acid-binding regulatory protein
MKASVSTLSWAFLISTTCAFTASTSTGIHSRSRRGGQCQQRTVLAAKKAGTFFNPVPLNDDNENGNPQEPSADKDNDGDDDMDSKIQNLGFGAKTNPSNKAANTSATPAAASSKKPFISIGPPANDVTKPEYDDQGYTVYTNEETGEKARVFEALVDYPCDFTMKIVGAAEGLFVEDMVTIVAESCRVEADTIHHTFRCTGKWTSVTVKAPVESATMLYQLYENIDRDPRVKFKF